MRLLRSIVGDAGTAYFDDEHRREIPLRKDTVSDMLSRRIFDYIKRFLAKLSPPKEDLLRAVFLFASNAPKSTFIFYRKQSRAS